MTNEDAISYAVLACKERGLSKEEATEIALSMRGLFDELTESEALGKSMDWLYESEL